LAKEPTFSQVHPEFLEFIRDAELIIHNAPFDIAFLNAEFERIEIAQRVSDLCKVLDTLALARQMHPGQRNNLDALCKRYGIDNSHRELHGALLDARILADVYLAMTGGQSLLALDEAARERGSATRSTHAAATVRPAEPLRVIEATSAERAAHAEFATLLHKASGGRCLWMQVEQEEAAGCGALPAAEGAPSSTGPGRSEAGGRGG
jgi:DNA polymerase-3 subunit epsilon